MATLPRRNKRRPESRSASTTARSRTSPPSSRSCARQRHVRSSRCSARTSNDWPRSPTATGSAPRTSLRPRRPPPPGGTDYMTTTPERTLTQNEQIDALGRYGFGWADSDVAGASAKRGLSEAVVRDISAKKSEPEWMLDRRVKALSIFDKKPMPNWGSDLSGIDFDNIKYFVRSTEKQAASWDELPADIKNTYDRLGIPEAEKQRLIAGVAAQYESEVVYHKI